METLEFVVWKQSTAKKQQYGLVVFSFWNKRRIEEH